MGETHETETLPPEMSPEKTRKSRRNGMWNIFEGVDNSVLEKLGLTEEVVHQIVMEADHTVTEHLASHLGDDDSLPEAGGCRCRRARVLRSFSATVGEEVKAAQQNRHRRNAVGNLLDVLTSSQKLLLVEHLQEQLEKMRCLCADGGEGKSDPAASSNHDTDNTTTTSGNNSSSNSSSGGIFLALTDLTSMQTGPVGSSVASSSPKEEVVCH